MGMPVTVDVRTPGLPDELLDLAFADLRHVDARFSPYLPASDVSRLNRGELLLEDASAELRQVLDLCRLYEVATGGVFTPWHAGRFDPSGLVKGWAIDRCAAILEAAGARSYFVDAGGDVLARGGREPGLPWRIGIRHPVEREHTFRVIEALDLAVATSGTYEKGEHIWNRAGGEPVLSFTVAGPDIVEADVFATACFAVGMAGLEFLRERRPALHGLAVDARLVAHRTPGFP